MKYIKFDRNNRVSEIHAVSRSQFTRMFTPDVRGLFTEYPDNTVVKVGQVDDGQGNFIDFVPPQPSSEAIKKRAENQIAYLASQALPELINFVSKMPTAPQSLKDIDAQIQTEKEKL